MRSLLSVLQLVSHMKTTNKRKIQSNLGQFVKSSSDHDSTKKPKLKTVTKKDSSFINFDKNSGNLNLNKDITDNLEKLQSVYESSGDRWRGLTYKKAAAIIKTLPEITSAEQLDGIRGIGKSVHDKVAEFINTGHLSKLEEFEGDPKIRAIQELSNIFGVGDKTAERLYTKGFRSVQDLRDKAEDNTLTAQQTIGLKYYEDLLEKIPRAEAETIKSVVDIHTQRLAPGAESILCGSYRRGRQESGDVDMIIVPPEGVEHLPQSFLAQLILGLERDGFFTDHLALPQGFSEFRDAVRLGVVGSMDKYVSSEGRHGESGSERRKKSRGDNESNDDEIATQKAQEFNRAVENTSTERCSYMGICKLDKPDAKHRRIDIKTYPRSHLPFALLYFAGPDHFGRSIRLHAKQRGYKLNDKGLFPMFVDEHGALVESGPSVPCKTEKDIFDALGLEYCEPTKRNMFEDLATKLPVKEEK